MGRPRKRRRADDEISPDADGDLPASLEGDTVIPLQASGIEDLLGATTAEQFDLECLGNEALSWDVSKSDLASMLDPGYRSLNEGLGLHQDDDRIVPLHLPMPTDTFQNSFSNVADEALILTDDTFNELALSNGPGCACLANLYLTLSSFQSLGPPSFPFSSGTLKKAASTACGVLRCSQCPKAYSSAFQNISLLGTLLPIIIMEYAKLLNHIDEKSARGESITFRMGIQDPALMHLHTGTDDCPMGFNVELSAVEWRKTARRVIRQQVLGAKSGDGNLSSVIDELDQRQHVWHSSHYPQSIASYTPVCAADDKAELGCLRVIKNLRRSIEALNLSDDGIDII